MVYNFAGFWGLITTPASLRNNQFTLHLLSIISFHVKMAEQWQRVSNIQRRHLSQEGCSSLKPRALVASKAFRGCYDFDKAENITDLYRQPYKKIEKKKASWSYRKPLEPGLRSRSSFLPSFVYPAGDTKFPIPVNSWKVCVSNQQH